MDESVLSASEITERLEKHPGWQLVEDHLHRELTFADFSEAFAFMIRVAEAAERLDHHPDWSNSWNKVVIDVVSHAAGGVTEQCFALVTEVDSAAGS